MKITTLDKTAADLLKEFFFIPPFQRPYDWEKEQVDQFWTDTVVDNGDDYFIGSVVLYKKAGAFGVVDGQQRITTLLMMLCAVRDAFDSNKLTHLAEAIQAKLERVDDDNEKRFVLRTETSNPYLQDVILRHGRPELRHDLGPEEERLERTFQALVSKVADAIAAPSSRPPANMSRAEATLRRIRDRTLGLRLITVELDNEDDAFVIFETLNTRGTDLQVSHLLKNHLSRLLKPKNKDLDALKIIWTRVHETFEASQIDIEVDDFLHHYWLSHAPKYVAAKTLFRDMKRDISTREDAKATLDALSSDAVLYRMIVEPSFGKWRREEDRMRECLRALSTFRVRQPYPVLLSTLRAYRSKALSKKNAEAILYAIERFHFAFTAISSKSSSGGLSLMYAAWARDLFDAKSESDMQKAIKTIVKGLAGKHPPQDDFVAGFKSLRYSNEQTKQKRLVQYVLRRFADALAPAGVATNHEQMTIEHIAPQNAVAGSALPADDIAKVGNLLWCDEKLQEKLKNKSFGEKKAILQKHPVPGSADVVKNATWGTKEIDARTEALAMLAFQKIWK